MPFLGAQGIKFARAAQGNQAMNSLTDQEIDRLLQRGQIDFLARRPSGVTSATKIPCIEAVMGGLLDHSCIYSCIQIVLSSVYCSWA